MVGIGYIWSFQSQMVTILCFGSFEVRKTFTLHDFIQKKTCFSDSEVFPPLVPPRVSTHVGCKVTNIAKYITWSTQYCAQPNEVSTICANYVIGLLGIQKVSVFQGIHPRQGVALKILALLKKTWVFGDVNQQLHEFQSALKIIELLGMTNIWWDKWQV